MWHLAIYLPVEVVRHSMLLGPCLSLVGAFLAFEAELHPSGFSRQSHFPVYCGFIGFMVKTNECKLCTASILETQGSNVIEVRRTGYID